MIFMLYFVSMNPHALGSRAEDRTEGMNEAAELRSTFRPLFSSSKLMETGALNFR
jgi:hypothetical protein